LWINNQQIINNWRGRSGTEQSGTFAMIGQQRYNIRMEYNENQGNARASLSWANPSMAKQIVPQTQLYPVENPRPTLELLAPANGAVHTGASLTMTASATCEFNTLDRVDFYTNGVLFGSVGNALGGKSNVVSVTATELAPGNYTLKAVAVDLAGLTRTSGSVHVTMNAVGMPYGLTKRIAMPPFLNMPQSLAGALPPLLSLTGVFTNTAAMTAAPGLIPYSLNVPMWNDYAVETHYVAIPSHSAPYTPDQQIDFSPEGAWKFPAGSVFVQTFEIATNEAFPNQTRRLETRLLVRGTNGAVYGVTYKWRPDNSDADLLMGSATESITVMTATGTRSQMWYYPSFSDCLVCHTPASGLVLGVNTRQLNGNSAYGAQTDNQLRALNHLGILNPAIDEAEIASLPRLANLNASSASLEQRVRSYMDVNCAECHRPGGSGITMDARYETPLAKQGLINATAAKGNLGVDGAHIVTPGDTSRSVLWGRMNTTNPVIKMPQLAHDQIDTNAVRVVGEWINGLR
jgi:uncharacterized repeat protein (TIGR03806 family)